MQMYEKTIESTAKEVLKSFAAPSLVATLGKVEALQGFATELAPRPYSVRFKTLFVVCIVLSYIAQVASLVSSYGFFASLLLPRLANPLVLLLVVGVVLGTIEILKRLLCTLSLQAYFGLVRQVLYVPLLLGVLVSGLSMYASVQGGGEMGVDTQQPITVSTQFDREIATLRQEIAAILQRNTYRQQTYLPIKERKLVHQKEQELTQAKNAKMQALAEVAAIQTQQRQTYQWGFLGFEALFLCCLVFCYDYKRKAVLENMLETKLQTQTTLQAATMNIMTNQEQAFSPPASNPIPSPAPAQRIGFIMKNLDQKVEQENTKTVSNETQKTEVTVNVPPPTESVQTITVTQFVHDRQRECLCCGTTFTYKHWNKMYCGDRCRKQAWELRTGKALARGKKEVEK